MSATDVSKALDDVRLALAAFNDTWPLVVRTGEVYELPVVAERETPERIEPVPIVEPMAATDTARRAIALLQRVDGQHPNRTLRLPGWFALEEADPAAFEHLNETKDKLRDVMSALPLLRRKQVAAAHRGISFLQAYRHVKLLEAAPKQIDFVWARRITSQKVTTAGAVRKELRDTRRYKPPHLSEEQWQQAVAHNEARLAPFADTVQLIYHRYLAPTPKLLIWHQRDRGARKDTRPDEVQHAALPVFFAARTEPPRVRRLPRYEVEGGKDSAPAPSGQPDDYPVGRKRRKDSYRLVPVIPEIHLYKRV